jgi:hypothetical protein
MSRSLALGTLIALVLCLLTRPVRQAVEEWWAGFSPRKYGR